MVGVTCADLQSQCLVLPRGNNLAEFRDFQDAYEVLKHETSAFARFDEASVWAALRRDALVLLVLRTVFGMSPPEWAEIAGTERKVEIPQNVARDLDAQCRKRRDMFAGAIPALRRARVEALVSVAVEYVTRGAPAGGAVDTVHRLDKFDTSSGIESLRYAAAQHVPYAVLLYERYLGRPFASHRDSISELIGEVMESAIEERLTRAQITFRRTKRAERIPGFGQAPDFFVPTEVAPAAIIEAKITGDDGTALRQGVANSKSRNHARRPRARRPAVFRGHCLH